MPDAKQLAEAFAEDYCNPLTAVDHSSAHRVRQERSRDAQSLAEALTPIIQRAIRETAARCADLADTRCGMDDEPHGMTCAPRRKGGKVYHEPRCCRVEADCIREEFGAGSS